MEMEMENTNNKISNENINKQCCCFNMRKVMRAVTQFFDQHLDSTGIRATQFTLLVELSATNAKTLTEIAEGLVMDRTTLTRNLKPLEKMELITTTQPADKRSKGYVLTDKGREIVNRCIPLWQAAQNTIVGSLGDERYHNVVKELEAVIAITAANKKSKR